MCRLLAIKRRDPFEPTEHLRRFAEIARASREYQGHGWGCAALGEDGGWRIHRDIRPIWDDDLGRFAPTRLLLAHARSAFRDEGITVENNMPFSDERSVFIFNGELRGVRIREHGRIGAEKIYNFIRRLDQGDLASALRRAAELIEKRTRYVRAMNIIVSDGERVCISSRFNEDADYFTMHVAELSDGFVVCSAPYECGATWRPIANGETSVLQ